MSFSRQPALFALALLLTPFSTYAQSASACPALPAGQDLRWEQMEGPGFLFCRAIGTDGAEAFAVTISRDSPFQPNRRDRAEKASIGGREGYWYRSQIAGDDAAISRETLVDIDAEHVAHITFRARDEAQMSENQQLVQSLRFDDARLTSN